ncbi:MAG: recombinase RmuC, partial [Microbacterium sp.]|uniref:DNA recombination protein RmuC n=1 Tax=Microbacterium sp. TaxID=51671 RepID=UPI00261D5FF6
MDAALVFILIVVAAIAAAGGWFAGSARASRDGAADRARLEARAAVAEAERDAHAEQLERQRELQRELGTQARLDQAARDERERREQAVLRALAPVQESLQAMQAKVELLERERSEQFGSVAEQLRLGRETDEALRSTTESLAGALRSSAARGVWGETQLRRIVESAGLTRYVDFELQSSISSDSGAGRPDLIVRLPGDKALAVDAKVPLDSYLEASAIPVTAQGEEARRRKALLAAHVKAVRAHVDVLAKKAYWQGLSSSPEFVVCFIPSESLLAAALDEDPALLDYAFS